MKFPLEIFAYLIPSCKHCEVCDTFRLFLKGKAEKKIRHRSAKAVPGKFPGVWYRKLKS